MIGERLGNDDQGAGRRAGGIPAAYRAAIRRDCTSVRCGALGTRWSGFVKRVKHFRYSKRPHRCHAHVQPCAAAGPPNCLTTSHSSTSSRWGLLRCPAIIIIAGSRGHPGPAGHRKWSLPHFRTMRFRDVLPAHPIAGEQNRREAIPRCSAIGLIRDTKTALLPLSVAGRQRTHAVDRHRPACLLAFCATHNTLPEIGVGVAGVQLVPG